MPGWLPVTRQRKIVTCVDGTWRASGAGLIALSVLAPVVSGTVWATVAAPGAPREPIAPALVVPFERSGGSAATSGQAGAATTSEAVAVGGAATSPSGVDSTARAGVAPTTTPAADDDRGHSSGPQSVEPDRVREVHESEEPESRESSGGSAEKEGKESSPPKNAEQAKRSSGHDSAEDED